MVEFEIVDRVLIRTPRGKYADKGKYNDLLKALLSLKPSKQIKVSVDVLTSNTAHANFSDRVNGKYLHAQTHDGFIYLWLTDKK